MQIPLPTERLITYSEPKPSPIIKDNWKVIVYALVIAGIFFRAFHFFDDRSLWLDEMFLSASLVKMNFWELATLPLEYQQKAPLGYLWLAKSCVLLFGPGEMALRLFPLVCGLASVFLFIPVCRYFLKPLGVAVAIGILALSPHLIYHSVEAKQYSTELLCTILALFLYIHFHKKSDYRSLLLWGLGGAVILWFSFSSIFVLAGIAGGVSLYFVIKKDWKSFATYLIPFSIWMVSFALNYFLFTSRYADSGWLTIWFQNREGFLPPSIESKFKWLAKRPVALLNFPLGLTWWSPPRFGTNNLVVLVARMALVHFLFMAAGLMFSYKKSLKTFLILIFPISLHLIATYLFIYPFYERLTVYLAPFLILILASGADRLYTFFSPLRTEKKRQPERPSGLSMAQTKQNGSWLPKMGQWYHNVRWIGFFIIGLFLAGPLLHSAKASIATVHFGYHKHWYQREMYQYLNTNFQEGDAVYIYWNDAVPYQYYELVDDFKFKAIEGNDHRASSRGLDDYMAKVKAEIQALSKSHKRVWVVYGKYPQISIGGIDNEPIWYFQDKAYAKKKQEVFSSIGKQTDRYTTNEEISLFLFETAAEKPNLKH